MNKIAVGTVAILFVAALLYSRRASAKSSPVFVDELPQEFPETPDLPIPQETGGSSTAPAYGGLTRGERNNNPGNIESGDSWAGLSSRPGESRFAVFSSPEYGIRAMGIVLRNYAKRYNLRTIHGIISRWAPSADGNNTAAYITAVSADTGFAPTQFLDLSDTKTLFMLAKAIIRHENGRIIYTDRQIADGVSMALLTS